MAGKIFITTEVSPEDLRTLMESAGVVTLRGGASSHAAMICRQIGKVCVVGVSGLSIDGGMLVTDDGQEIPAGIMCMVDGSSGRVIFAIGGINSVIPRATLSEAQRDMLPQLRTVVREGMRVRRKLSRDARNALDQIKEALSEL
jgi:phosphoenolpyruvate synthase/pyruvate phosphate dikinase